MNKRTKEQQDKKEERERQAKVALEMLRKAEIKRVGERLNKKELCDIYGFHYTYYMNCVSGRNIPSVQMQDTIEEYLVTPTNVVHEKVFAHREKEEKFHDRLEVDVKDAELYLKILSGEGIYREPRK